FLNAAYPHEIIFTKNCTEGINLVAHSLGETMQEGDTVLLSYLEHHSNIVPWLQLKERKGITTEWMEVDGAGRIDLEHYEKLLSEKKVKLVAITGQSNVLGVRPPLGAMISDAHAHGARVLVDAAQLAAHHQIDVQKLGCDFLTFSGHKVYGPTGIGVLYGKREILETMPPFLGGGMMIHEVKEEGFSAGDIPEKFEAGTPPITQAIGMGAAIEWLQQSPWEDIEAHEQALMAQALRELAELDGITIFGPADPMERSACISFMLEGIHPHDFTEALGKRGICLRAGHHCAQPLHRKLGLTATVRLSLGIYNTHEELHVAAWQEAMAALRGA
ncbi:MAG: cysteine desulfurase, partial [Candidatus Peribacteraceae bacterium]|nr:cysteine desulfurase [Candidatus Peribacteraceae bacterium]